MLSPHPPIVPLSQVVQSGKRKQTSLLQMFSQFNTFEETALFFVFQVYRPPIVLPSEFLSDEHKYERFVCRGALKKRD